MDLIDRIKELALSKYPEISVSDNSGVLSLHYSECESYSDYLELLNDETLLISDDDYQYVASFLQDLNDIVPICVVCSTDGLSSKAFRTHFAPLEVLLSERRIEYCDGASQESPDKYIVFIDIIASTKTRARIVQSISPEKCFLFAIISEKESKGDETVLTLPTHILNAFEENTKLWPRLGNRLPYQYLYSYVPRSRKTNTESFVIEGQRRLIYSFKDGKLDWKDSSVLNIIATEIEDLIYKTFESDDLPFLTWFCIPPTRSLSDDSTLSNGKRVQERFMSRFGLLSERVCTRLKMKNGLGSVVFDDSGNYSYNSKALNGANIILFDDLITTGRSAVKLWQDLEREGANVLCVISLERTVSFW